MKCITQDVVEIVDTLKASIKT